MPGNARPPTMDDVAARAGVSRALVSLVMRGSPKVSEARREAVLDAARELGYRPNAAARSLAERRSNTIGVVIDDLHNPFFADVIDGIHQEAAANGYQLLLNVAWRQDEVEVRAVEGFLEHRVDAVILIGTRIAPSTLIDLGKESPLVVIGADVGGVDVVVNDDERGGELVVEHLVELGHRTIAHVDGGDGAGADQRRGGFVSGCEANGVTPIVIAGDYTEHSAGRAVEEVLRSSQHPTALFAANDLVAIAAIEQLEEAGLRVPGDISVVGYDNTAVAALSHISLTTVNQPKVEMGRVAARCVVERLDRDRRAAVTHVLEPQLVVRRTSAPPMTARP